MAPQLASSSVSTASVSLSISAGNGFSIEGLLAGFVCAGFVGPQGFERLAGLALLGFAVGGELQAHACGIRPGLGRLAPLPAREGQGRQHGQQQRAAQACHGATKGALS